jgi:rod shape-determining protein MreC
MLSLKFDRENRARMISNGVVVLIALIGFVRFQFEPEQPTMFANFVVQTFAPLQKGMTRMRGSVVDFYDHYLNIVNTSKNNDFLQKRIAELSNEVFELSSLKQENLRLKSLLAFGEKIPYKKVLGQIIGWDASAESKILRIDKGSVDGIQVKSAVITADGLVGYTYKVYEHYSDILTIIDNNNKVDVVIDRTRTHGIIEGTSHMYCRMKYVPQSEEVFIGDILVTAGLSLIYPKGIKVGEIVNIKLSPEDLTQEITVRPSVDFTKLEEVVVLTSPADEQQKVETTTSSTAMPPSLTPTNP